MRALHSSYSAFRRVRALVIGVLAASLLLLPAVQPPTSRAAGTIVQTQNLSNTADQSEAPRIALRGGRLAAIWGERNSKRIGYDTTTPGATWPAAAFQNTGTNTQYQWPDIVVDGTGTFHVAYAVGDTVFHRSKSANGQLSAAHTVANSSFPNPVRMALAPNGTLWVVWRDSNGTGIFYRRSTDGGLTWTNGSDGGVVASESGNMFSPDVAVGTDNIPHVVWYIRGSGSFRGDVRVADWNGSSFDKSSVTTDGASGDCCYDADPSIVVDAQNVQHAIWRKQLAGDGSKWAITYARRPGGGSWQDFTPVDITNGDAKYSPYIGFDTNGTVYVTYSDPMSSSSRRVSLFSKAPGANWDGPLAVSNGRWDYRGAVVGGDGEAHIALQHEQGTDDGEIIYYRVVYGGPGPQPPSATPVLDNGNATSNGAKVTLTFKNVTGSPNKVRYHWDAAPTDADAWTTPIPTSLAIDRPGGVTADACQTHILYLQAAKDSTLGAVKQASITFDIGIQGAVDVVNPHMRGLPSFFGASVQDVYNAASPGESNVSDGDPRYTRERFVYLGINGYADCSGLKSFSVLGSDSKSIQNNIFNGTVALPGASAIGPHAVKVTVTDTLSNSQEYSRTLIYDPANTDTTGTNTNTLGLPILDMSKNPTVTITLPAKSIVVPLSFSNINVNDTVYGQNEQLPAGKQFWGVWIANSTSVSATADDANLNWYPVRVPTPDNTFTVQWDLFSGLGFTSDLRNKSGDYYVFVRFLDGAGNPTTGALKVKVTLAQGYSIPTVPLPIVRK